MPCGELGRQGEALPTFERRVQSIERRTEKKLCEQETSGSPLFCFNL